MIYYLILRRFKTNILGASKLFVGKYNKYVYLSIMHPETFCTLSWPTGGSPVAHNLMNDD